MHGADVPDVNGRAVLHFQHHVLNVGDALDVAAPPDVILGASHFERLPAYVVVAGADTTHDITQRNAMCGQRVWIEIDLIFLYESADWRDFGDTLHCFKRVAQIPILNGAQLREIVFAAVIDERVFKNPADACRVGPEHRIPAFGERAANRVQIFKDTRARPVNVGAILKNHVNERLAEHRFAPDELYVRRGDEE